jgi:glyoxylase-like metal-dependent hydrolase (beta-lactamase superfamily II)
MPGPEDAPIPVPNGRLRRFDGENRADPERISMSRLATILVAGLLSAGALPAHSQAPTPPLFSTTKVPGTDNVYIFRYQGHQAMFVVTPDGVIATDPISERRPAAAAYIGEIRKITQAPIRYVIYSHSHFDHIAGGQPFKDLGATFVSHWRTKSLIEERKRPDVVVPDLVVDDNGGTIALGGTTLELLYLGKNHGDNSLIMRLPKEKVIFVVDFLPLSGTQFRQMADTYVPEQEATMKKILDMDWTTLVPGHPGAGRAVGNKEDVKNDLDYVLDLSAAVKKAVEEGKSYDQAIAEIKLPKYQNLAGYQQNLAGNIERYYDYWNRGI